MQKLLLFFCLVSFSFFPKHHKNSFFDDFEKLIFSLLGQNFKVNNLATCFPISLGKHVAKLLTLKFSHAFIVKALSFVINRILPAERRIF